LCGIAAVGDAAKGFQCLSRPVTGVKLHGPGTDSSQAGKSKGNAEFEYYFDSFSADQVDGKSVPSVAQSY